MVDDKLIIDCNCGTIDHILKFEYFVPDSEDSYQDNDLYITGCLDFDEASFWKRLKTAFKYLLNKEYVLRETIIKPNQGRDILQFLQKYISDMEKFEMYE
jgi:hypothetical protein